MMKPTSETADIVIIGGGILGCAIAYYLSRLSSARIVLVERRTLAEATTTRAAGLLTRARAATGLMPLIQETYQAIETLESELGESLGLRRVGSLHLAISRETKHNLMDLVKVARDAGLKPQWLDPEQAMALAPWLCLEEDEPAVFMPDDGFIDPYVFTHAYARAAKARGAIIWQNTAVTAIHRAGDQITGVTTDHGLIASPIVIDAAGVWAGLLSAQVGCHLPMAPVLSHYWITTPHTLFPREQPIILMPDAKTYTRPEGNALLFGLRETQSVSVDPHTLPADMNDLVMGFDREGWGCLIDGAPALLKFFPRLERIEIAHYVFGLSTYTPDGLFLLGGLPDLNGFLAATGCSGAGVAASGGIGLAAAELALGQTPTFDLEPFRLDRFGTVDPLSASFRQRCADARSRKTSG
jgi:sarcosine oxidase, subunit beta